jgi:hypothetical protein
LTPRGAVTIITFVLGRIRTALVAFSLAPCLAFSAVLPQEHRHDADAGHPHAIVHQHFAAHDHDDAELSPADRVTWLEQVAALRAPLTLYVPAPMVVSCLGDLPPGTQWVVVEAPDTAPAHGPPRRNQSLRAPPLPFSVSI